MWQFRLRVPPGFLVKEFINYAWHDWPTVSHVLKLQLARETFNWRHPFGADGWGDTVQQISLRPTDLCNLRCCTCGQWGEKGYLREQPLKDLKQRELSLEIYKKLVDEVVEAGWSPIWYIWGGEPMLYPDLFDLMRYIAARHMPLTMVTNGVNVVKHIDEIIETCQGLWLSIDGPTAKIHNQQRPGVSPKDDNFSDVMAALKTISAEKKRQGSLYPFLGPITTISKYNVNHLADIYRLVSPYADVHTIYLAWWIDEPAAREHTADFERRFGFAPHSHWGWVGDWKDFDHSLIFDQFEEMWRLSKKHNRCPAIMFPNLISPEAVRQYYQDHTATFGYKQCFNIYSTIEVDSNGNVSLCRDYRDYVIGNIKTDPITKIWQSEAARQFRRSISEEGLMPVCRRCCGLMGY
ncbi:MAG: radical SAM protein [Anaerolineae bacterium]|nr:radical SAM protein [Anaerolineae bacterium]